MSEAPERIWLHTSLLHVAAEYYNEYPYEYVHINQLKELEARLKKAIEIADELAYDSGKWIADIDYEEFDSWREELDR